MIWRIGRRNSIIKWQGYRVSASRLAESIFGTHTLMDTDHGSATDEVWFAYRGNLYEVMADAKIAALLKSMLATWTFI
jgi:hypothetical protein